MIYSAISAVVISACAIIPGCTPDPEVPALVPCDGISVTVYGFDGPVGCDLTPPQTLNIFDEHPAPWSPIETDTFFTRCADAGGTVTDRFGDAWVCSDVDY